MGTAMKKSSQIQLVEATSPVIPERVVVAMAEIDSVPISVPGCEGCILYVRDVPS
jgi:hypothetical protein